MLKDRLQRPLQSPKCERTAQRNSWGVHACRTLCRIGRVPCCRGQQGGFRGYMQQGSLGKTRRGRFDLLGIILGSLTILGILVTYLLCSLSLGALWLGIGGLGLLRLGCALDRLDNALADQLVVVQHLRRDNVSLPASPGGSTPALANPARQRGWPSVPQKLPAPQPGTLNHRSNPKKVKTS